MARVFKGILDNPSGSVGPTVWCKGKKRSAYVRAMPQSYRDAKTEAQMDNRAKMKAMMAFLSKAKVFVNHNMEYLTVHESATNLATKLNYQQIEMSGEGVRPKYEKMVLSRGNRMGIDGGEVAVSEGVVEVRWEGFAGGTYSAEEDWVNVFVYNATRNMEVTTLNGARRGDKRIEVELPEGWEEEELHVWVSVSDVTESEFSESQYFGGGERKEGKETPEIEAGEECLGASRGQRGIKVLSKCYQSAAKAGAKEEEKKKGECEEIGESEEIGEIQGIQEVDEVQEVEEGDEIESSEDIEKVDGIQEIDEFQEVVEIGEIQEVVEIGEGGEIEGESGIEREGEIEGESGIVGEGGIVREGGIVGEGGIEAEGAKIERGSGVGLLVEGPGGLLPSGHAGFELRLEVLIVGVEVGVLGIARGENYLLLSYFRLKSGNLRLDFFDSRAEFAELAFTFLRLLETHLGFGHLRGSGLCGIVGCGTRRGVGGRCLGGGRGRLGGGGRGRILGRRSFKELEDIALELMEFAIAELVEHIGEPLEEIAVVGNQDECARVLEERVFEDILRIHVEMVGGLVEYQEIGGSEEEFGEGETCLLATGEHLHLLVDVLLVEEETAEDVADFGADVAECDVVDGLEDRLFGVEHSRLILCIVAHLDIGAEAERAGIVAEFADEDASERGFALAVLAHESDFRAGGDEHIDMVEDLMVAKSLAEVVGFDDDFAAVGSGEELEMDTLGRDLVDLDSVHALEHLDAGLDLSGLGGLVAEALDESLDLRHLSLLVGELSQLTGATFTHLNHIFRVGAAVVVDTAGGDFDGAGSDIVEESAVVGDENHGAGVGREKVFEPLDRDDVEVVGGLVEEEEVGASEEEFGEFDTHLPPPAELRHGAVEIGAFEAEAEEDFLRLFAAAGGAEEIDMILELGVTVEKAGIGIGLVIGAVSDFVGELLELIFEVGDVLESGEDLLEDRDAAGGDHFLREIANRLSLGADDGARLGLLPSAEDFEERGFAGAVFADEADAVTVGDVESNLVEEILAGELDREIVDRDHDKTMTMTITMTMTKRGDSEQQKTVPGGPKDSCRDYAIHRAGLAEVEGNGEVELDTDSLAALFTGFPLRHSLDDADSFLTAAATDVTQDAGVGDRTILLDHEGDIDLTGDVVFLSDGGVLDVFAEVLIEGFHAARELGVVFDDGEDFLFNDGFFFLDFDGDELFLSLVGVVAHIDDAEFVSHLGVIFDDGEFGSHFGLFRRRWWGGVFGRLNDDVFDFIHSGTLRDLDLFHVIGLDVEGDEAGSKRNHQTDFQIETFLFFEVGFGAFLCFHIIDF